MQITEEEKEKFLTADEGVLLREATRRLAANCGQILTRGDYRLLRSAVEKAVADGLYVRDRFGLNPLLHDIETANLLCERLGAERNMVLAILLQHLYDPKQALPDEVSELWGSDVAWLLECITNVANLYARHAAVHSENFRKLLMTFAKDIRVIIIMIVERVALMKAINHHPSEQLVNEVALEASYLYAPLAHRMGLYTLKSDLEDMSLKYTNRETYTKIAQKLNQTKEARDEYIADFIRPVKERLEAEGLKFEIKGRTKSIYSIWNKIRKQKVDMDHIYDLFAIRIILESEPKREKSDCWMAYSLITDMFRPNPARMKDWLSIPKSNGYESLHITVYGPKERWVEVQIRTRRMDDIAEKGLAAHWKYKGVKTENNLDAWAANIRDVLEAGDAGPLALMKDVQFDLYDKEVFAFTPKGDLYKLPMGATVLDFAFNIHTDLGARCTGARVNGKHQKINYRLKNGDTVEIQTGATQTPKHDWLNYVVTPKARNKIRVTLKEMEARAAELGREMLERRFKNRKIEVDEALLSKTIKRLGYKNGTDFFDAIARQQLDVNTVADAYLLGDKKDESTTVSASEFVMQSSDELDDNQNSDVLVIGQGIRGVNYSLARCCNPIYGDDVFGFISGEGVIKIHRTDCPNANHLMLKYPYRLIRTRWSGKVGSQFGATLRIVGKDDIGIVTNITSIINKEKNATLRNISIDSNDGLFQGYLVVGVNDTTSLNQLIKKLSTVKGVKNVERSK